MNMDMQSLIEEMNGLVAKIKTGEATFGEIEAFAAAAQQLNERAIILRYKAYETQVFGTLLNEQSPAESTTTSVETPTEETTIGALEEHNLVEENEESSIGFDLFSLDEEVADEEPTVQLEEAAMEKDSTNNADEIEELTDEEINVEEPIFEQTVVEDATSFELEEKIAASPIETIVETPIEIREEPVAIPVTLAADPVYVGTEHPIYSKLITDTNSLAGRLLAVRLETLKGAFGFNERLQLVQELFSGSNDAYNEALETLDNLGSKAESRQRITALANQYKWDIESKLALEFVQKVERRYA